MLKLSIDEKGLLRAIARDFDNDLPRLVYADWLDEQGRSSRAEFIRLQCEEASGTYDYFGKQREQELLTKLHETWAKELPQWALTREHDYMRAFERGFISSFEGIQASMFVRYGPMLLDRTPVSDLGLMDVYSVIDDVVRCPWLREIPNITIYTQPGAGVYQFDPLFESEWLVGTRYLCLGDQFLRDETAMALANCRHLCNLEYLDLRHNHFTPMALHYLAGSDYLRNVHTFRLRPSNGMSREELRRIFGDRWKK